MPLRRHILLILLALASAHTNATSRMVQAAVITEAGLPCFKIADEEERVRGRTSLTMLTISEQTANGWQNIWMLMFRNESFGDPHYQLPKGACIRYGHAPVGVDASDAKPLQAGKIYSVFFMGRPPFASDPTSRYGTEFCMLTSSSGELRTVQLSRGAHSSLDTSCARPAKP